MMGHQEAMIATAKDKPVQVRFPSRALLKQIDAAARRNGRSRNSEILCRLAESFSLAKEQGASVKL